MAGVINSKPSRILPTAAVRILMRIMYCTVTSYVQNMKSTRNLGLDFSAALRIHIFMLIMHLWSESALQSTPGSTQRSLRDHSENMVERTYVPGFAERHVGSDWSSLRYDLRPLFEIFTQLTPQGYNSSKSQQWWDWVVMLLSGIQYILLEFLKAGLPGCEKPLIISAFFQRHKALQK